MNYFVFIFLFGPKQAEIICDSVVTPETIRNFTCIEKTDGQRSILRYDYCELTVEISHDSEKFSSVMVRNEENQTYVLPSDSILFDAKLKDSRNGLQLEIAENFLFGVESNLSQIENHE